jgi:ribosomal protein S27E
VFRGLRGVVNEKLSPGVGGCRSEPILTRPGFTDMVPVECPHCLSVNVVSEETFDDAEVTCTACGGVQQYRKASRAMIAGNRADAEGICSARRREHQSGQEADFASAD